MPIRGTARIYGSRDLNGDLIRPGAFQRSLERFRSGRLQIHLMDSHRFFTSIRRKIGEVTALMDSDRRLQFEAELGETGLAMDARRLVESGMVRGVSIGWTTSEFQHVDKGRDIIKGDLMEISLVLFPAQPMAMLTRRP